MYRRKLILLVILVAAVAVSEWLLSAGTAMASGYSRWLFPPLQTIRMLLLGWVPFSIGDILYTLAGCAVLAGLCRFVYHLFRFNAYKHKLGASCINAVNIVLGAYLCFTIGWGANYYKEPLARSWALADKPGRMDTASLVAFDDFLVRRINELAPAYRPRPLRDVSSLAVAYYEANTDTRVKSYGLGIKPSLYSFMLERMGVDGYYNPFTAEGQVNSSIPGFMLPFVLCHEMAHQAGVATEDDANLVAYALCTRVSDSSFNYSACLNLWLYTNNRLFYRDSARARQFRNQLGAIATAHLDTLRQISKKARNQFSAYSSELYDNYLKMQRQAEGIASYGQVVRTAWLLEKQRADGSAKARLQLP